MIGQRFIDAGILFFLLAPFAALLILWAARPVVTDVHGSMFSLLGWSFLSWTVGLLFCSVELAFKINRKRAHRDG